LERGRSRRSRREEEEEGRTNGEKKVWVGTWYVCVVEICGICYVEALAGTQTDSQR
jgi:hypothetical protein